MQGCDPDEWWPPLPAEFVPAVGGPTDTLVGQSGPESTLTDTPPVTLPRARHAGFTAELTESV